ILVAEDNEFNARYLERLLARLGHSVRQAINGREALELLGVGGQRTEDRGQRTEGRGQRAEAGGEGGEAPSPLTSDICTLTSEFDLLLLDLHMPEFDGFQVIRAIRDRERAAGGHLPVIALTARSKPEDRERGLAAGMDDYMVKPVRAGDLFAAIE